MFSFKFDESTGICVLFDCENEIDSCRFEGENADVDAAAWAENRAVDFGWQPEDGEELPVKKESEVDYSEVEKFFINWGVGEQWVYVVDASAEMWSVSDGNIWLFANPEASPEIFDDLSPSGEGRLCEDAHRQEVIEHIKKSRLPEYIKSLWG